MHVEPDDKSANQPSAGKVGRPPAVNLVEPKPRSWFGLSLTQVLGSTAAAVTAAFLGSRLGVAGTLVGAALASTVSVVFGAVYTHSIKATGSKMRQAIGKPMPEPGPDRYSAPEQVPKPVIERSAAVRPRSTWHGILLGVTASAAVFVGAMLVVTGFETVSGQAVSGGPSGGLSILGGNAPDGKPGGSPVVSPAGNQVVQSPGSGQPASGTPTGGTSSSRTSTAGTTSATRTGPTGAGTTATTADPGATSSTATTPGTGTTDQPTAGTTTRTTGTTSGTEQGTTGQETSGQSTTPPGPSGAPALVPSQTAGTAPEAK